MALIWRILLVLSNVIGWLFWLVAAWFVMQYIHKVDNPLKHELGIGMAIGVVCGAFPALFSFAVSTYFRADMPKILLWISQALLPTLGLVYGIYMIAAAI